MNAIATVKAEATKLTNAELFAKLDELTVRVTAFGSWADMVSSMNGGYCPTLRSANLRKNASAESREYQKAVGLLREACVILGFKAFDGRKVV